MRQRSMRLLTPALAARLLSLGARGLRRRRRWGRRGRCCPAEDFAPTTEAPDDAKEGGTTRGDRRRRRRLPRPRGDVLPVHLPGGSATHAPRRWSAGRPTRPRSRSPTSPRSSPRSPTTARPSPSRSGTGINFSPPVDREVTAARLQVRDRAHPAAGGRPTDTRRPTSATSSAGRTRPLKASRTTRPSPPTSAGVTGARRPDAGDRARPSRPRRRSCRRCRCRSSAPVPEEYAKEFDAESPSTYGEHLVATGPYMIENDAEGELDRIRARASRSSSFATRTGIPRPITGRRTSTRSTFTEGFTDVNSASRKILSGESQVNGRHPPRAGDAEAGGHRVSGSADELVPGSGNRYVALNTTDPAVRRHQRPQGGDRGRRPRGVPPRARRRAGGRDRHPLHLRPAFRGSRRPAASREPASTSSPTRTAIPELAARVHAQGRLRERQVRGQTRRS